MMPDEYKKIPKTLIQPPKILAFGSSTGGLNALTVIMKKFLGKKFDVPIIITQHIADKFDNSFVETITKHSGLQCKVGEHNMEIEKGIIYVAPANYHMRVEEFAEKVRIKLDNGLPINFCKPSVDPLFESLADLYGKNIMAVMLTGIGNDGLNGARKIVDAGGTLIAQDQETSVVWGMPGAVAKAGLCTEILPLDEIPDFIIEYSFGKIR